MSDGSIDIDDTQGDVSAIIKDIMGSIDAKIINVGGNLVINNSTTKERATLKKIQDLSTETNAIEKGIITREEFNALQRAITEIKNLLERNQAYSIKAGNVQVSRNELSLKEILLKGNEYLDSRHLSVALDYYDQAIKIDPNYAYVWNNKGWALSNLGKYDEAIECYDTAINIDPNYADAWNNKGVSLRKIEQQEDADRCFTKARELGF
ncbi:MAG: tetratricopeptide repeat protein [Thermoproteota archaeon]|nr:tetratricopeptide repeat protein [Thermoproteota archaeon]